MTELIKTTENMREWSEKHRCEGDEVGLVPTMGALHEGHMRLIRESLDQDDQTIVSIFINPLQFSPNEDFDDYPRQFDDDMDLCESAGVAAVFNPEVSEFYSKGFATYIEQEDLPEKLCGESRPEHFRGVMTVVCKLYNATTPHRAYYGQKDYQQYLIVKRMTEDLSFGIDLELLDTVREEDGLAVSSRNKYLSPKQREEAPCLYEALQKGREAIKDKIRDTDELCDIMREHIEENSSADIEYLKVLQPETLQEMKEVRGDVLIAVAAQFGKARLIDNIITSRYDDE